MVWILLITLGVLAELFGERDPAITVAWFQLIPMAASLLSPVLGKMAGQRQQGREAEANYNQRRDELLSELYRAQQSAEQQRYATEQNAATQAAQGQEQGKIDRADLDLKRRKFTLEAPDARLAQAIKGSLTANARDARATHPRANVVHFEGGPKPSMLNADARKLGELLARQALMAQLQGDKFDAIPDTEFTRLQAPQVATPTQSFQANRGALSTPPRVGGFDKFLNAASQLSSLIGAFAPEKSTTGSTPPFNPRGSQPNFIDPNLLGGGTPRY